MSARALTRAAGWLASLAVLGTVAAVPALAQQTALPGEPASAKRPAAVRTAQARPESSPAWRELTPPQQQALAPLAASWSKLSEAHKRKWLALSANYPTMPTTEQALLHSRMAEWAALSPQQRTQARMNFAESKAVPADDRKAKWEAYQALPPEEKKKLAAGARAAKPPVPATAAVAQPEGQQKVATPPANAKPARPNSRTPRIAGAPGQVDTNTLLPQPGAAPESR